MASGSEKQKLPPYRLVASLDRFRKLLLQLNRRLFPGNVVLYEHFQYFWMLPALYVAARLDIASLLQRNPLTAEEIARATGCTTEGIRRIMRALSSQGVFAIGKQGRYRLNRLSRPLLPGPGSLRDMILHHLGPLNWQLMSHLELAVRTGNDPFSHLHGKGIYEYLKEHPEEYALFDRSMTNLSDLSIGPILHAHNFSVYDSIADIGGGEGALLASILRGNPEISGILFDTAEGLVKAPAYLQRMKVSGRISITEGDFFSDAPKNAALYILKNIIHNWNDQDCKRILGNIRQQMPPHSKVMIIEMIIPESNKPSFSKLLDIQMLASMKGGKERTAAEFRSLLSESGFSAPRIIPTIAPLALIIAGKA